MKSNEPPPPMTDVTPAPPAQLELTAEERRLDVQRRCRNLLSAARRRGTSAPAPAPVLLEEESSDDEDSEGLEIVDVVLHADSFKQLEKEAKELNAIKKGDKNALIGFLREEGLTQKKVGKYLLKLVEKPASGISAKQLRGLNIPTNVLTLLLNFIAAKKTLTLNVTKPKTKKRPVEEISLSEAPVAQRQRTADEA